jgi:hypothetical protein
MVTPHPEGAILMRPDGQVVYLQGSPPLLHTPIPHFGNLGEWLLSSDSVGTIYTDGEPAIGPVIFGPGRYHLYVADNIETEPENTYFIECYFEIPTATHN